MTPSRKTMPHRIRSDGQAALAVLLIGCGVYDEDRLDTQSGAAMQGSPSTSPQNAAQTSSRGKTETPRGGTRGSALDEDAGTPPTLCGDGRVSDDERCDSAIAQGRDGACPFECKVTEPCVAKAQLVGDGCQRRCAVTRITEPRDDDGCCPSGADPARDRDCGGCGDGVISTGETCDPPESCPDEQTCRSEGCYVTTLTGNPATCSSICVRTPIVECEHGDACCPAGCSRGTDDDCALACGDGVLDEKSGETCEPQSTIAPCVTSCDDGDVCTTDALTGSSQNCNARCSHFAVTAAIDRDGCCPPGANAANDSDCTPRCGNNVREGSEECDGGPACTADCKAIPMEELQCRSKVMLDADASDACRECVCTRCAQLAVDCYDSGDAKRDRLCAPIVQCARRSGCTRDACYCGTSPLCSNPNGECRAEIEDGADTRSAERIDERSNDRDYALVRAQEYTECERDRCDDSCGRRRR